MNQVFAWAYCLVFRSCLSLGLLNHYWHCADCHVLHTIRIVSIYLWFLWWGLFNLVVFVNWGRLFFLLDVSRHRYVLDTVRVISFFDSDRHFRRGFGNLVASIRFLLNMMFGSFLDNYDRRCHILNTIRVVTTYKWPFPQLWRLDHIKGVIFLCRFLTLLLISESR